MLTSHKSHNPALVGTALIALSSAAAATAFFGVQEKAFVVIAGIAGIVFFSSRPEYGILTFITTFLLSYPGFLQGSGFITLNNLLGAFFCVLLVRRILQDGRIWFLSVRQIQWLAAIGVLFLISTWFAPTSPSFLTSLDRTQKDLWDFFSQFAFVILFIHFIQTRKHLTMVFGLILAVIICSVPSSIYAALFGGGDYRAAATLGINMAKNSNHLAFYCLFGLTTLWYIRQELQHPVARIVALAVIVTLIFVTIMTASRNALLNLIFLSLILALEAGFAPKKLILSLMFVGCLALVAGHVIPQRNLERITSFSIDPTQKEASRSMSERGESLKIALEMFRDMNPILGFGPGNFRWIRQLDYDRKKVATHNAYVWALLSGGILTLFCYLGLFWSTFRDLHYLETRAPATTLPPMWMVKATRTNLMLFLVFSLFTEAWLEILLFILIGLTVVMKQAYLRSDQGIPAS